jgi:hypothetical protein
MRFYQVTRYVGFSIGAGLAVTLLRAFSSSGDGPPGTGDYAEVLLVGAVLCALAALVAWLVPGRALGDPARRSVEADEDAIEEGELAAAGLQRLDERI